MKKRTTLIAAVIIAAAAALTLTGCDSQSTIASKNISTDAEQFKIERNIVLYNTITDKYIAQVIGKCSIDSADSGLPGGTLSVTCKIGKDQYIKDNFGKADNALWFELQQKPVAVDVYHYEVIFRPEQVIPNLQVDATVVPNTGDGSKTNPNVLPVPTSPVTPSK